MNLSIYFIINIVQKSDLIIQQHTIIMILY